MSPPGKHPCSLRRYWCSQESAAAGNALTMLTRCKDYKNVGFIFSPFLFTQNSITAPKSKKLERSQIIHSVHLLPWWNQVNLDQIFLWDLYCQHVHSIAWHHCWAHVAHWRFRNRNRLALFVKTEEATGVWIAQAFPFVVIGAHISTTCSGGKREIANWAWPRYLCVHFQHRYFPETFWVSLTTYCKIARFIQRLELVLL